MTQQPGSPEKPRQRQVSKPVEDARASDPTSKLDQLFLRTFSTTDGAESLRVLKAQFVHAILPSTASDQELRYREGSRHVVGFIEAAIGRAHNANRRRSS